MSIETRVSDALDDFENLVIEGASIEDAARQISVDYNLRPEVILKRAHERFGELSEIAPRAETSRQAIGRKAKLKHAIFEYNQVRFGPDERPSYREIEDWVEEQTGFTLTQEERNWARTEMQQAFHRSMLRQLDVLLKEHRLPDAKDR